ncbi:sensor domain-containing diguanylate cyclase [Aeromonas allosaccharophila]|uniref:Sensor domain-containing diguanylate cyclase n=1 Tax=Aeromonas allosaccharophila TaxID=656 RepID=A0A7T2PHA1_9GAMM|nr:sensor domain-containing diguanylate cyclase [Aeromonas allosaccharophila]QPR55662.1 sensor domain-containing diguanylate cyclase [Aeromonas allosaccharophila]
MKDEPFSTRLQHELDHLRSVFNEMGAYLFTKDLDGRYTYANQAVLDLFGCTLDELQGQDDTSFFSFEDSNAIQQNDRQVLDQQIAIAREEVNYLKPTGEKRVYWTVKKPMYDRDGMLIGLCGISTDITEHKLIETRLAEQHKLLEIVLANVDAHIYMKDSLHHFLYVNQKVCGLLGLPAEQIINRRDDEVIPAASACQLWRLDNRVFETGELQAGEETLTDSEGNQHYYWSVKVPFLLADGTPTLIGISSDITELHQLKEQLHQQSVRDGLTGLYNRRFFFEMCEKNLSLNIRHHLSSVLMVLDVDQFKCINDRYGHPLGDQALVHLGKVMLSVLRSEDVLARIGGDEFAILLPNTTLSAATCLAERLRQQVMQSPLPLPDGDVLIMTISAGLVENSEGELMESLYARADQLLYQAKQTGRNCVACKAG